MRLKKKLFAVRLPIELIALLDINSQQKGITKTFAVTQAIKDYFNGH